MNLPTAMPTSTHRAAEAAPSSSKSQKPTAEQSLATTIREHWSDKQDLSGSKSPWLSCHLANQMLRVSWRGNSEDPNTKLLYDQAVLAAMAGIAPRDPVEGLLAAQKSRPAGRRSSAR